MRKSMFWVLTRSVQSLEMARGLKFWIQEVEVYYYPNSKNKGADQLHSYRELDLHLCFAHAKCWFSHDAAHIMVLV